MKTYGLIGRSLSHSFSADYFNAKFQSMGIDGEYLNFPLNSINELPELFSKFPQLEGLNVTIPYKKEVLPFLDYLSPEAQAIGAVNTIRKSGESLFGYNTDVAGFAASIKPFLAFGMERALILGSGGAAAAATFVFEQLGIEVWYAVRDKSKFGSPRYLHYSELNANVLQACRIIVNATPLGTWPNISEKPDLPYIELSAEHLLVDMVYNPETTAFMQEGSARGAIAINGLSMLYRQAEESWKIWNLNAER